MCGKDWAEFDREISAKRSSHGFDLGERRGNRVQDR